MHLPLPLLLRYSWPSAPSTSTHLPTAATSFIRSLTIILIQILAPAFSALSALAPPPPTPTPSPSSASTPSNSPPNLSASSTPSTSSSAVPTFDDLPYVTVEGFVLASTLYPANWFRAETRATELSLIPIAKQGFDDAPIVDSRLCQHCPETSVVLLETGELCWFDLETKRSGKIAVCEGLGGGCWLGCEFGGQPWIVFVACELKVFVVDLRTKKGMEAKVLVSVDEDKDGKILAFC